MTTSLNYKLGDLVKAGGGKIHTGPFGSQLHASDYVEVGIPCIMPVNMKNNRINLKNISFISQKDASRLSKYIVEEGDIVYSRRGDITQKALIQKEEAGYFCGTGCLLLRPGKMLDPYFLTYYLSIPAVQKWVIDQSIGATMPNLNTGILANVPFNGLDIDAQKKIAAVLKTIDKKIELNNNISFELEKLIKLIYDYWFIQFDFPNDEGKPYRSSGGPMIYSDKLKSEIPVGWQATLLKDLLEFDKGTEPGAAAYSNLKENDQYVKFYRVGDIAGNSKTFVNSHGVNLKMIKPQDVVVTFDGSVGKIGIGLNGAISGGLRHIYDKSGKICNSYIYALFNDNKVQSEILKYSTGSVLMHASKAIDYLTVPFAETIVLDFQSITQPMYNQLIISRQENEKLIELRDWLLPMLMNGQVRIEG